MKKYYLLFIILLSSVLSFSQTDAISYQAVILSPRSQELPGTDAVANILPNKVIAMRFTILRLDGTIDYQETQLPMTDAYGLVNLFIGEGTQTSANSFDEIEWDGEAKNLKVEIDFDAGTNFTELGVQKITFVPYSYHRNITATGDITISGESSFEGNVEVGENTDLQGNLTVDGDVQFNNGFTVFGITTFDDDIIVNGTANFNEDLNVEGVTNLDNVLNVVGGVFLGSTLTVEEETNLNNNLNVSGQTNLNDDLIVNGNTQLNGVLDVVEATTLNSTLNVNGETTLDDNIEVNGNTRLNGTLDVEDSTTLNSTLNVNGETTLDDDVNINGNVQVNGTFDVTEPTTLSSSFSVRGEGDLEGNHIAVFENTDGNGADGILIQLGKTHGAWDDDHYLHLDNTVADVLTDPVDTVQGWFDGDEISPDDILSLIPTQALAGSLAHISNSVIENINEGLDLPRQIVPRITVFPGYYQIIPDIHIEKRIIDLPGFDPFTAFPGFNLVLPNINIPKQRIGPYELPEIPELDASGVPNLSFPNFNFSNVSNSLDSSNEYITFIDKDGHKTGAVRAQSVDDWKDQTIYNGLYLLNVATAFIKVDQVGAWSKGVYYLSALTESFNSIGVEYSSGNGDYAEWLEREDKNEFLTPGDIVGVRGGKISKNLEGAEQVMVISNKPIVLGNLPNENMIKNGNTVAFMGQVPVKVMGSIQSGDYIVPNKEISGYGKAINPQNMTVNDYKMAVGRAWVTDMSDGPKLVNTVVGIHNGNWVNIFNDINQKQDKMSERLNELENELIQLKQMINNNNSFNE